MPVEEDMERGELGEREASMIASEFRCMFYSATSIQIDSVSVIPRLYLVC